MYSPVVLLCMYIVCNVCIYIGTVGCMGGGKYSWMLHCNVHVY